MTWVVAGNCYFNAIIAADIRVTFNGVEERDCLLKIYPVAANILGGFAGSVQLGFEVLDTIRSGLGLENTHSLPKISASRLPRLIRRIFRQASLLQRALGRQFLFTAVHPNRKTFEFSTYDVYRFIHPHFEPERVPALSSSGIGCGENTTIQAEAHRIAREFAAKEGPRFGQDGPGLFMASYLHDALLANPSPGISPWSFYGVHAEGGGVVVPLSYRRDDPASETQGPPRVARNYEEFRNISRASGLSAEGAQATARSVACS